MTSSEQALLDEMKSLISDLQYKIAEQEVRSKTQLTLISFLQSQLDAKSNKEYDC